MTVSVVIPAYNVVPILRQTVPAVLALRGVSEWIWVDDGSTDGTVAELEKRTSGHTNVLIHQLETNQGRASARNAGIERATGDFIACLDADAAPRPGYLDAHLRVLGDEDVVVSMGRIEPADAVKGDPYSTYLARYPRGPQESGGAASWKHFVTCAACLRADTLREVGGFNTSIGYGEDAELACRLASHSPSGLHVVPEAVVDLYGTERLAGARDKAKQFGQSLRQIQAEIPDALEILELTSLSKPLSRGVLSSRSLARLTETSLGLLPAPLVSLGVRYLLGHSLYQGFSDA